MTVLTHLYLLIPFRFAEPSFKIEVMNISGAVDCGL